MNELRSGGYESDPDGFPQEPDADAKSYQERHPADDSGEYGIAPQDPEEPEAEEKGEVPDGAEHARHSIL